MVGQDQIDSFSEEMNKKSVDWQFHSFGNAMHAFTNPDANDPSFGTVYSQDADQRSWKIFKDFLSEIFS
jgi:dienelactone hydrolase